MAHVARRVSSDIGPGSVLDAVLAYATELHLIKSYQPGRALMKVEVWRLIHFAAEVRQEIGDRYGLVSFLMDSIRSRLMTDEAHVRDAFPRTWAEMFPAAPIEAICFQNEERLRKVPNSHSLEELALLAHNTRLLGRRGPREFMRWHSYARTHFIEELTRIDPNLVRTTEQSTLLRIIQGLAAARYRRLDVLEVLADECVRRSDSFSPAQFADVVDAFGCLRAGNSTFCSTFASCVERNWNSYRDEKLLFCLWSLAVAAPDKVPHLFNASILRPYAPAPFPEKVTQTLIALGRYTHRAKDRAYQQLLVLDFPHLLSVPEKKLMLELPIVLGVPDEAIFPQVIVGGFETDFVVDFGHSRLIIELDGGGHFLSGPDGGILQGRDEFQDRVFRMLGYEVFHVPLADLKDTDTSRQLFNQLRALAHTLTRRSRDSAHARRRYLEDLPKKDNNPKR